MQIAIDTGGTFTDCLGRRADGTLLHLKLPSTPHDPTAALLDGVARLVAMAGGEAPTRIVHGSTVATNALLEGTGGEAVLILDRGYEDLLLLARQQRPDLYALEPRPIPRPLPRSHVLGFPGRTLADGSALSEATDADFAELLAQLAAFSDLEAIGICFLHGHAHPGRERALREALHGAGLAVPITCSHELSTSPGEYERAVTTALNARLIPVVGRYLNCLGTELAARYPGARLEIVLSNGDALPPHEAAKVPVRMLLSGPAGGVQFGMQLAEILGRPVLTLDIGGTSTDCACIPGEPLERLGGTVAGLPVQAPMLDLETVGAGGGSILWVDAGDALQVGPRSTGADPGPACYGLGGTLPTLTDAHVVLGHLSLDRLLGGTVAVNPALATAALAPLAEQLGIPIQEVARGAIAITDQRIAEAVRQVSAARGHDPSQFVLVALGGAGGLHAAGVAQLLGIDTVCFPPLAGLASARGLAACGVVRRVKRALGGRWPLGPEFVESYLGLVVEAREGWRGLEDPRDPSMATTAWARYVGQDASLGLGIESPEPLDLRFHALHRRVYGFAQDDAPVELTALEVALSVPQDPWPLTDDGTRRQSIDGPFIVAEDNATLLIPDGATAALHPSGCLLVSLVPEPLTYPGSVPGGVVDSAVALTLANDLLSSVAEEMALALEHSAHSSNIKDRRDLSTAVFDAAGRILAQGAHIPVHLGSMQTAVEGVLAAMDLAPGQTAIVNSPYHGGTHLPDITLVTCVDLGADQGLAYVASRAHHADIGGAAPGSMPLTNHVEDEGLLIPPTLFAGGEVCCAEVLQQIRGASRQPDERVGDLVAQLGANLRGAARLREVVAAGAREFATTADALIDYAAAMVQSALGSLRQGSATGHAMLESDGLGSEAIPIQVRTSVEGTAASRILTLDFTGTAPAVAGPVNCPRAVATAAVAYCLRCLVPAGTPTNAGMLRDVRIHIPPGCLLDAPFPHPTAAGNVETSQKVVEAVFAALASLVPGGLPAPSQGTMNNILFGGTDPRTGQPFTYYETLAGGCGAGPSGPGASALHSHMTNSRNTPIEVLEGRFPVIVGEYALRVPSGGRPRTPAGFPGGHGVRRAYQFLAQATVTVLADWPALSVPREGDVGSPPKPGAAYLLMHDDGLVPLPSKWSGTVEAGTLLLIATPGGWAWDPPL